jgi:CRP/FNR family cyclic AMP-dependent transcriptional regulator
LPDGGVLIPLRLTQTELAGLMGASRVRVNQALGYYRKRGSISVARDGRITVHDEEALAHRAR